MLALLNRLRDVPGSRRGALVCKVLDVLERTRLAFLRSLVSDDDDDPLCPPEGFEVPADVNRRY